MGFGIHRGPGTNAPWILRDKCIFQNKKLKKGESFLLAAELKESKVMQYGG